MYGSSLYPAGAENDPNAPYNQPDEVTCPCCKGTGVDQLNYEDDCDLCKGTFECTSHDADAWREEMRDDSLSNQ